VTRRRVIVVVGWILAVVVIVVVVSSTALMLLSRRDYGTFAFWSTPERINYCGRRYYPGDTPVRPTAHDDRSSWRVVGHTFGLEPIYAPGPLASHAHSRVCTFVVYVPASGGRYWAYSLSGGP
jgi:hypothetical protein